MAEVVVRLFKNRLKDNQYKVGVVSHLGEKRFYTHDSQGVGKLMYYSDGEIAVPFTAGMLDTRPGKVLSVDERITSQPVHVSGKVGFFFDNRLTMEWVSLEKAGSMPLDGSASDARGRRYFQSKTEAVEWVYKYLESVLINTINYTTMCENALESEKEIQANRRAEVYAAENADNYGEEYGKPLYITTPNTWWNSLSESERNRIYQENKT